MSKPRLAEILGVEVDEDFEVDGYAGIKFKIDESGELQTLLNIITCDDVISMLDALVCAINYPEYVIQKPKWTKQDVEDAKVMKKYFPDFDLVKREMMSTSFGDKESLYLQKGCNINPIGNLKCFPSLPIGKSVKLDDIINSEVQQ